MVMKKVLVIEDDQVLRENLTELLELAGYSVIPAEDGKKGVEMAIKGSPNIILCDIIMPELNGYQVLDILNEKKMIDDIPFIFLSAKSDKVDIRCGMNLGADDYITKPFEEDDVISAIETRLAKSMLLKEHQEQKIPTPPEETIRTLEQLKNCIQEKGDYMELSKKQSLYSEGEKANYTYLLDEGVVKTDKMDDWGKELIFNIFKKGDLIGYSFFTSSTYEETATALEKGSAFKILNTQLREILVQNPSLTLRLAELLSDDLSELKDHLLETAYSGVLKKTSHTIVHFAKKMEKRAGDIITISRGDLASVAGISTESFIRSLSLLKKDNLIEIEGRNIKILDFEKLKKIK